MPFFTSQLAIAPSGMDAEQASKFRETVAYLRNSLPREDAWHQACHGHNPEWADSSAHMADGPQGEGWYYTNPRHPAYGRRWGGPNDNE